MRLVAWNCCMALHRKVDALMALRPDVAVISECAEPDRVRDKAPAFTPQSSVWVGTHVHKGLGVFTFNGYQVALAGNYEPSIRHIAPLRVDGRARFNLLAVWVQLDGHRKHEAGPMIDALDAYGDFIGEGPTMVAGDLNNHVLWDKPVYAANHANAVARLDGLDMVSAYHAERGVVQGAESEPTHYWRDRAKDGPTYHIDYVFLPRPWADRMTEMWVGGFEAWCGSGLSDHVPLVVDVDI